MIYLYLKGHHFEYDVHELIKVFFFGREIVFIDDCEDYKEGILIENRLDESNGEIKSTTRLYQNHNLVYEGSVNHIEDIDIKEEDIKKKIKIGIKQNIYEGLISISTIKAPWGILTGIRPVKIVHSLLDEGVKDEEILKILMEQYKLVKEKGELILDIASKQRKHIYPLDEKRFSLYVAIPFCPTRCLYCSFPSCNIGEFGYLEDEYTDKLIYEIQKIGELMHDKDISTVYIGGGTPTAIATKNLERIIHSIYKNFDRDNIKEVTVEAGRPDTIDIKVLEMLNKNKVDRISINPQTMNDKTLKLVGRKHNSQDIIDSYNMAKEIGFDVINMDLIVGLPSEGLEEIKTTLDRIELLNPENLTVHTLSVKRGSKFKNTMDQYCIEGQNTIEEMLKKTSKFAEKMGLSPYYLYRQKQMMGNFENIGYTKEGKECIYNILMMEEKETIMAAGMGAVSKIFYPKENRIERIPNVKSLQEYLGRIEEMIDRKVRALS